MEVDARPFVSAIGRSCTIYVERDGAEMYASHLENLITTGGGTVTRNPDQAAAVVVVKRGSEMIERRIAQISRFRLANPWVQGVVDLNWVTDCIKRTELLGPPEWGGYLLKPQQLANSEADVRDAVRAVFGLPGNRAGLPTPQTSSNSENSDRIRLSTSSRAAQSLQVPPSSRHSGLSGIHGQEQEEVRGRSRLNVNSAWNKVKEIVKSEVDPQKLKNYTQGDLLELILYLSRKDPDSEVGGWEAFAGEQAKKTSEAPRTANAWRKFYKRNKELVEKCVGIVRGADHSSGHLTSLRDNSTSKRPRHSHSRSSRGRADSEDELADDIDETRSGHSGTQAGGSRPDSSRTEDRPRSRVALRQDEATVPGAQGLEVNQFLTQDAHGPTQYTDADLRAAMKAFVKTTDSDLKNASLPPVWKDLCDDFIQKRLAEDPTTDFIAKQIKLKGISEADARMKLSQDHFWKAFAIVNKTSRNWKEWQRKGNGSPFGDLKISFTAHFSGQALSQTKIGCSTRRSSTKAPPTK
ncbi:hypothetical protein FRB90_001225 [Tulasnella sp. 427]|nr:hypothetical protein FRB90_001225 [Tulasnella sp. 427]